MSTEASTKTRRSRAEVRRDYGHPWPWRSKELVREEYVEKDRTITDIADDFGCAHSTVWEAVDRFELKKGGGQ